MNGREYARPDMGTIQTPRKAARRSLASPTRMATLKRCVLCLERAALIGHETCAICKPPKEERR